MKLNTKVLIVGGGPAGAMAAGFLAGNGFDCLLLEKNRSRCKPCGGGLSLSAFEELSLPKSSIKKEILCLKIVSPKGEHIDIDLKGHPLTIVDRQIFDESLRQQAQSQGARILEGELLRVLETDPCLVEALIGDEKIEITSEFLIAADGVNSRVRSSLGIKPLRPLYTISEKIPGLERQGCEFWFGASHAPRTYSWVFPEAQGLSIGTAAFDPRTLKALLRTFKNRIGIQAEGVKQVYPIPVWDGKLYHLKHILFTGDAAGQVLPLSYEGIYYALQSGDLAAQAVVEGKAALYKTLWKSRFQKRFLMLNKLEHFFLKNDAFAEKMVRLHKIPEVRDVSLMIWLGKDNRRQGLLHYARLFGRYLR